MDNSIAFTAIDAVSRSNAYSGSRQQTEGGGVAFTAIDAVSRSNAYKAANWGHLIHVFIFWVGQNYWSIQQH